MIFIDLTEEEAEIVIDALRSERAKLLSPDCEITEEIHDISTAILKIQDQLFWTQPQSRIH